MAVWLVNAPNKGGRSMAVKHKKRKPPKGFSSWGAWMRHIRPNKGGGVKVAAKKKRKGGKVSFKKKYRPNPPGGGSSAFTPRAGFVGTLMDGAVGAAQVLGGKVAVRLVPGFFGVAPAGYMGLLIQAGLGLGVGYAANMMFSRDTAKHVLYGALLAPTETIAKQLTAGIPMLSAAFADEPVLLSAYPQGMSSYPRAMLPAAMGEEEGLGEDALYYQ